MYGQAGPVPIRWELPADHDAVARLHAAAFGDDAVPRLVEVLRTAAAPMAPRSCVAVLDPAAGGTGEVVGHDVMLTAARLDARERLVDVLVLSPLAVLPQQQRRGIGSDLVRHALELAAPVVPLLFVEGDPGYYGARGFERADTLGFRAPSLRIPPAAFQVARLPRWQPWMTGTLVYSEPFWALDLVGLRDPRLAERGA